MIESLILLLVGGAITKSRFDQHRDHSRTIATNRSRPTPGLSSQAAQIKPVAASKQPYLGPKRPRSAEFYRNRRTKKAIRKLPF